MLPHEKGLVERLKNEPFSLIGINSDSPKEEDLPKDADAAQRLEAARANCKRILDEQGIAWRNAIEGSTSGPIATRWNVQGWPTIYILDADGRIRFKNLRDEQMEEAVMELLGELKGRAK
jgi:hypothetical protein